MREKEREYRGHTPLSTLGLMLHYQQVRAAKDFEGAFAAIAEWRPDGLLVLDDPLMLQQRRQIVDFTTQKHLPGAFYSPTSAV